MCHRLSQFTLRSSEIQTEQERTMHPKLVEALQNARREDFLRSAGRPEVTEYHRQRGRRYFGHAKAADEQPLRRSRERAG